MSGSGKSVALHVLEDLGYYCIDNIPAALLKSAVEEVKSDQDRPTELLAVGVDARNRPNDIASMPELINELREQGVRTDILFLHASDEILLKRYSESRRRHPLAAAGAQLRDAIRAEREILGELSNAADLTIDTSTTSIYELADVIRERVDQRGARTVSVLIESFGFKYGIPADADFVFDMRCLPNPYWSHDLRGLTGLDVEVQQFLHDNGNFIAMFDDVTGFLKRWIPRFEEAQRGYLTIAIGCTGGQHRSVCMTEMIAEELRKSQPSILTRHHNLPDHRIQSR